VRDGVRDAVSGGAGRSCASRSCVPGDGCVRGWAGDGGAWLGACGSGLDGPSGLRSSRFAEAVPVRIPAAVAFVAAVGGGVPAQRGTDVAVGLAGARTEIGIGTMAYNLKRMVNLLGASRLIQALTTA
jgi:hypothetical protein